jgi:TonB-dependent starch-binding outer membrane protein SusC
MRMIRRSRARQAGVHVPFGLAFLLLMSADRGVAQDGTVRGTVVDVSTQRPISGAQITVTGTQRGTVTDAAGRFTISGLSGAQVDLRVIMIGYRTAAQAARVGDVNVRIALTETVVPLDELAVTATAGEQRVRSLGNSIGRLKADQVVEVAPASNVHALLGARVPGVQIQLSRGEIGAGANIRIRGASSMSLASEPLLYIDGVRVNNSFADNGGGISSVGTDARTPPSRINDLNPEDIESVEVIKGPAAATLYGTEASNGVIQIVTKKGRSGRPAFNMVMRMGASWLPNPERLFPLTYYRDDTGQIQSLNVLRNDRTVGFPVPAAGGCPRPYRLSGDRCKGEVFSTGAPRGLSASLTGGTESIRYYFSGDVDRNEGPVDYNWQNRLSGRGNLSWIANEKLTLDVGLGAIHSRLRSASAQQPITTAVIWSCPAPGCEAGSGKPNAVDGPFRGYIGYLPERYYDDIQGFQDVDRQTYSFTANHRPFSWFSHRLILGGDFTDTRNSELYKRITGVGSNLPNGRKEVQSSRVAYVSADYGATATLGVVSDLKSATSAGVQFYRRTTEWFWARGDVFPVNQLETVSAGATRTAQEDFLQNKTLGAYVQEQLTWKDRVFVTGAVRGDDNSAFGRNFDFVVYPKFSLSWVLSEESFVERIRFLNDLKLRGAWGKAGLQPDVFASLRTYQPQVGVGGEPALTTENLGNADLEPEVGRESELGFDASLFQDRVGIELTVYDKRTKDAIVRVPALPSLGFPGSQFRNIGEVANTGMELGLRGSVIRSGRLGLDLGLNFSRNRNEVVDIGGGAPLVVDATFGQYHAPGFPLASIFVKRVVSADIEQVNNRNVATNVMCEGGTREPNSNLSRGGGAPVPCAQAPAIYRGSPLPTWNGNLSATLTVLRNLRLHAAVEAVGGNTWQNGDISGAHAFFNNTLEALERDDPIFLGYETLGNPFGSLGVVKGDFAKLRTVSANYTLPQRFADRLRTQSAMITLAFENMATLWVRQKTAFGVPVIDPEARNTAPNSTQPGGLNAYNQEGWPQLRRFTATFRVSF